MSHTQLTPRMRGRRVFDCVWKTLEKAHPNFKVLSPLSPAMECFLQRKDPTDVHEIVEETGSAV